MEVKFIKGWSLMKYDFELNLDVNIYSGNGKVDLIADKVKALGTKVFLVMDPFFKGSDISKRIINDITRKDINVVEFYDIVPNPRNTTIDAAAGIMRSNGCDIVVAVGGGSTIDTAKAISLVVRHGGECWEYTERSGAEVKRPKGSTPPIIAVPTTSGTGSEVTIYAVVNNKLIGSKNTIVNPIILPRIAILDPELTMFLPREITALAGIDAFSHCFESYISSHATVWSEMISIHGMKLFSENIRECCFNGVNLNARANMMWASALGGMGITIAGATVPHALGQPIGAKTDAPHGGTLAACLPAIIRWTLPCFEEKLAITAEILDPSINNLSLKDKASCLPDIMEKLFTEIIGERATFKKYGIKRNEISAIADLVIESFSFDLNKHPKIPNRDDLIYLIQESM